MQRSAKEIKVKPAILKNKKVNVEIGAIEKKDAPHTIYVSVSFWTKPKGDMTKEENFLIKRALEKQIRNAYKSACEYFSNKKAKTLRAAFEENIFILKIPDNFYYNKKKNFINLEIHINTCNISSEEKYPLNNKKDTMLFDEALDFTNNIINNDVFKGKGGFIITSKNKA